MSPAPVHASVFACGERRMPNIWEVPCRSNVAPYEMATLVPGKSVLSPAANRVVPPFRVIVLPKRFILCFARKFRSPSKPFVKFMLYATN